MIKTGRHPFYPRKKQPMELEYLQQDVPSCLATRLGPAWFGLWGVSSFSDKEMTSLLLFKYKSCYLSHSLGKIKISSFIFQIVIWTLSYITFQMSEVFLLEANSQEQEEHWAYSEKPMLASCSLHSNTRELGLGHYQDLRLFRFIISKMEKIMPATQSYL